MFIEVTHTYSGSKREPRLVNTNHIMEVEAHEAGGARIKLVTGAIVHLDQSYEEVRRLIDQTSPTSPRA